MTEELQCRHYIQKQCGNARSRSLPADIPFHLTRLACVFGKRAHFLGTPWRTPGWQNSERQRCTQPLLRLHHPCPEERSVKRRVSLPTLIFAIVSLLPLQFALAQSD